MGWEVSRDTWPGSMTLVAKVTIHTQQICGLAWSPEGELLASGGNDNLCCLFEVRKIFRPQRDVPRNTGHETLSRINLQPSEHRGQDAENRVVPSHAGHHRSVHRSQTTAGSSTSEDTVDLGPRQPSIPGLRHLESGSESHRWHHGAAVKAIAFCPWRDGLVATGGGSNDKCIHFFHTVSGAALATICVSAQVTSLIWSTTRREIAATFGYPQPEHPFRIAVFSWPECRQVAAIP